MASRTAEAAGDANTPPQTAAVNMPSPTYPAKAGSWPLPPPEISVTCLWVVLDGSSPVEKL